MESFLDRVEQTIATRVRTEVDARLAQERGGRGHGKDRDPAMGMALGSLGIGVPLTAIAAGTSGMVGLLVAWIGIAIVNMAYALGRRRGH